jgi:mannose-6-phosphate isomerase-like protein (cupin superfamily)
MQLDVSHPMLLALGRGEGEAIVDTAQRELRILSDHDWLNMTWTRHAAGERGAEPHIHRRHTDAFYVLEGEMTVRLGPDLEEVVGSAGTLVVIPPGVVHGFDNESAGEVRFLNMHAPGGGFVEYLRKQREGFDSFDPPADGGRPATEALVIPPAEGERLEREDRVNTILAALTELSVFRLEVEPAWPGIGAHAHDDQVDTFFVLEGETGFIVGDDVVRAGADSFYVATPGVRHGVRHDRSGRAVFLNVHGPDAGFAERMRRR